MPGEVIALATVLMTGVVTLALVAGFFVTRLAKMKVQMMQQGAPARDEEIARLDAELANTRQELHLLEERQKFVEQLLEKRPDPKVLQQTSTT